MAAKAFNLFEKNITPAQAVIQLQQPPSMIEKLYQDWITLSKQTRTRKQLEETIENYHQRLTLLKQHFETHCKQSRCYTLKKIDIEGIEHLMEPVTECFKCPFSGEWGINDKSFTDVLFEGI